MNTLDKFLAVATTFSINELDTNDLFYNFCFLDNKYSELLKYENSEINLYIDIKDSIKNNNLIQLKRSLFITMDEEKKDAIDKLMTVDEKIGFYNLTKDYVKLNMERYEKGKSI